MNLLGVRGESKKRRPMLRRDLGVHNQGGVFGGGNTGGRSPPVHHISSRMRMRSSIGGWVSNRRSHRVSFGPGVRVAGASQRWAVALFATRSGVWSAAILRSAEANPGG